MTAQHTMLALVFWVLYHPRLSPTCDRVLRIQSFPPLLDIPELGATLDIAAPGGKERIANRQLKE